MKWFLFFPLIFLVAASPAQNLAPNPSFESYVDCPTSFSMLNAPSMPFLSVSGWSRPTIATSDYLNACASDASLVSVPENLFGPQNPRTGSAYTGLYGDITMYEGYYYREYITSMLEAPLVAGHRYYTSYWVSLAEWNSSNPLSAIDQLGALFTNDSIEDEFLSTEILEVPQIVSPEGYVYMDTTNWEQVSGKFIATGDERWLTIGNFTPGEDLTEIHFDDMYDGSAYYFIDDICILDIDVEGMSNTLDTVICIGDEITIGHNTATAAIMEWNDGYTGYTRLVADTGIYWVKSVDLSTCTLLTDTFKIGMYPPLFL